MVYCSIDPDFTDCVPIEVGSHYATAAGQTGISFIFLGILSFGFIFKSRKKKIIGAILLLTIVMFITNCKTPGGDNNPDQISEYQEFTAVVENLQTNSTYYWKVTANATDILTSESVVRNFITE